MCPLRSHERQNAHAQKRFGEANLNLPHQSPGSPLKIAVVASACFGGHFGAAGLVSLSMSPELDYKRQTDNILLCWKNFKVKQIYFRLNYLYLMHISYITFAKFAGGALPLMPTTRVATECKQRLVNLCFGSFLFFCFNSLVHVMFNSIFFAQEIKDSNNQNY